MHQARHIAHYLSIQNIASFKNNTSTRIIILDSVSIVVLGVTYYLGWILYALPFVLLIAGWLVYRVYPAYPIQKYAMYQRLFKHG
jgi:hypothetical protein